jgi:hypothetical protein
MSVVCTDWMHSALIWAALHPGADVRAAEVKRRVLTWIPPSFADASARSCYDFRTAQDFLDHGDAEMIMIYTRVLYRHSSALRSRD